MADKKPYANVEEIVRTVLIGPTESQQPCFYCSQDIDAETLTIKQGEKIIFNSMEDSTGLLTVSCGVIRNEQMHTFVLPLSQKGDFYEWEDDQLYSIKEIAEWSIPKSRSRSVILTNACSMVDSTHLLPVDVEGCLVLAPIYEVQAVMKCKSVHIIVKYLCTITKIHKSRNVSNCLFHSHKRTKIIKKISPTGQDC